MRQLVDENVEYFIYTTIQTYGYFPTLVCIVAHGIPHSGKSSYWDVAVQHVVFTIIGFSEMFPENVIPFLHLRKLPRFARVMYYVNTYDE